MIIIKTFSGADRLELCHDLTVGGLTPVTSKFCISISNKHFFIYFIVEVFSRCTLVLCNKNL